jgi:hypothetical protein
VEQDKMLHSLVRLLTRQELLIMSLISQLDQRGIVSKEEYLNTFQQLYSSFDEKISDQIWLRLQKEQKKWDDMFGVE